MGASATLLYLHKKILTLSIEKLLLQPNFPGMSPQRIELLITKKLEENIRKIPEIKKLTSISETGSSIIHVKIEDKYFNLDAIWQSLRNKVKDAEKDLPEGASTPYVNDEFGDVAVITMALTSDGFGMNDMHDMAKHIRDIIYGVKGIKKIDSVWSARGKNLFKNRINKACRD